MEMRDPALHIREGLHLRESVTTDEYMRFWQLIEGHDEGLRRLAYRMLSNREDMDDVLQEVYIKAFRGMAGFRGDASLGTWLYRLTYNACIDRLRQARRGAQFSLDEVPEAMGRNGTGGGADWDDPAELVCRRDGLSRALAALPPEHRATVLLVDAEGYSQAEAAEILGIPAGTVASRLHHARAALRRVL